MLSEPGGIIAVAGIPCLRGYEWTYRIMTTPKQKPGLSKQDYGTPPEFLTSLKTLLKIENFELDLAANKDNTVCEHYYCEEYDSLKRQGDWSFPEWVFLNPPYSNIAPWVEKAYSESLVKDDAGHRARIAVLVPASVGSNWWRDWVHMKSTVLFLNGRLIFAGEEAPYPKDSALLLYDEKDTHSIHAWYEIWGWKKGTL